MLGAIFENPPMSSLSFKLFVRLDVTLKEVNLTLKSEIPGTYLGRIYLNVKYMLS